MRISLLFLVSLSAWGDCGRVFEPPPILTTNMNHYWSALAEREQASVVARIREFWEYRIHPNYARIEDRLFTFQKIFGPILAGEFRPSQPGREVNWLRRFLKELAENPDSTLEFKESLEELSGSLVD